jgi:hypothetical protein
MSYQKIAGLIFAALAFNAVCLSEVNAATATVKCEVRTARSKISVDGRGYGSALYRARVQSGTGVVWAKAFKRPINGQLEFDFDSDRGDILAGATPLASNFIKNRAVNGRIYSYNPTTRIYSLRAMVGGVCSIKR